MANSNYIKGRAFEYERMKHYRSGGAVVMRTSGSHGPFDLIVISPQGRITCVQCKVVKDASAAARLEKAFKTNPPFRVAHGFHQKLEVKVTRLGTFSWTL